MWREVSQDRHTWHAGGRVRPLSSRCAATVYGLSSALARDLRWRFAVGGTRSPGDQAGTGTAAREHPMRENGTGRNRLGMVIGTRQYEPVSLRHLPHVKRGRAARTRKARPETARDVNRKHAPVLNAACESARQAMTDAAREANRLLGIKSPLQHWAERNKRSTSKRAPRLATIERVNAEIARQNAEREARERIARSNAAMAYKPGFGG